MYWICNPRDNLIYIYIYIYSGTPLKRTPPGPTILSVIQGCPSLRGYTSHTHSSFSVLVIGLRQKKMWYMDQELPCLWLLGCQRHAWTLILAKDVENVLLADS